MTWTLAGRRAARSREKSGPICTPAIACSRSIARRSSIGSWTGRTLRNVGEPSTRARARRPRSPRPGSGPPVDVLHLLRRREGEDEQLDERRHDEDDAAPRVAQDASSSLTISASRRATAHASRFRVVRTATRSKTAPYAVARRCCAGRAARVAGEEQRLEARDEVTRRHDQGERRIGVGMVSISKRKPDSRNAGRKARSAPTAWRETGSWSRSRSASPARAPARGTRTRRA